MKPPWYESRGLTPWMLILAAALSVAVVLKEGLLSRGALLANKELIDTCSKLLTSVGLAIGGIFSYFRFFKGRTFRPKLVISCQSGLIPLGESNLHWLNIQIDNKGSVAIWNYDLRVEAIYYGPNPESVSISDFLEAPGADKSAEFLVDVGESSFKHAILEVPKEIPAVSFQISVADQKGSLWEQFLTTTNKEPSPNTGAPPDPNRALRDRRR